jgi:hypothetical protein
MADAERDVLKIYDDLMVKFTGADQAKAPEGFVVSLLPQALPVNPADFRNPFHPADAGPASTGTPEGDAAALEKINQGKKSLYNLCQFLDRKLMVDGSGRVYPSSTLISQTWQAIVTGANARPLPPIDDPHLAKQIDDATKLIFKADPEDPEGLIETGTYQRYKSCRKKYHAAVTNYATAFLASQLSPAAANAFTITGKAVLSEVESARDDWISLGKKDKVEEALAILSSQGTDAATALISAAKKQFEDHQLTLSMTPTKSQYVQVLPSNWCDPKAEYDGWTQYGYKRADTSSSTSTRSKSWSVAGGVSKGFWSAKGSAGQTSEHTHTEATYDGLEIQLRIAAVDILRPGLSTALMNLGNWFLVGQKKLCISDGSNTQQRPGSTESFFLPGIPTQMILVKELRIKTANTKQVFDELKKTTEVGGSVGIGPFSIGGNYKSASGDTKQEFHEEGGWIVVDGIQVVGYVSQLSPPCPQLDSPNLPS